MLADLGLGALNPPFGTAVLARDSAVLGDLRPGVVNLQPGAVSFEIGTEVLAGNFAALADLGTGTVKL